MVLDGFLQFLAERLGRENVHYLLVGGRSPDKTDPFPVILHELVGPTTRQRLLGVLRHGLTGRASLQEALLSAPGLGRAIRARLAELDVDLEIYDTMRVAQHAAVGSGVRQVCYLEDLHSERYGLMQDALRRFPGVDMQPLGTFAEQVPSGLRPLATSRAVQQVLLGVERRLTRSSEERAAARFETNLLVNGREAELLQTRAGVPADRVRAVPPMVRVPSAVDRTWSGAPEFVFLGLLTQPHNEDGVRSFLADTWPEVLRRRPDAVLRLVGRHPRPALSAAAARFGRSVVLEGFVPDLDGALAGAAAMINPLRFGSGVKIKVIEALSRGMPVVSSPVGADGIESGPGTGVLVGDGVDGTVDAMVRLIGVEENRAESEAARKHFDRRYSRESAFECYDAAFGFAAGDTGTAEVAGPRSSVAYRSPFGG